MFLRPGAIHEYDIIVNEYKVSAFIYPIQYWSSNWRGEVHLLYFVRPSITPVQGIPYVIYR